MNRHIKSSLTNQEREKKKPNVIFFFFFLTQCVTQQFKMLLFASLYSIAII